MAIAATAPGGVVEQIGGVDRRLRLGNGEIERFEGQYAPFGIFDLWARFAGEVQGEPQARHCRDIVALALVGGGMSDRAADDLVASLPPWENPRLRIMAIRVVVAAFTAPDPGDVKKNLAGSDGPENPPPDATTLPAASATSAA